MRNVTAGAVRRWCAAASIQRCESIMQSIASSLVTFVRRSGGPSISSFIEPLSDKRAPLRIARWKEFGKGYRCWSSFRGRLRRLLVTCRFRATERLVRSPGCHTLWVQPIGYEFAKFSTSSRGAAPSDLTDILDMMMRSPAPEVNLRASSCETSGRSAFFAAAFRTRPRDVEHRGTSIRCGTSLCDIASASILQSIHVFGGPGRFTVWGVAAPLQPKTWRG